MYVFTEKVKDIDETHKLLGPVKLWFNRNRFTDFEIIAKCSLTFTDYADRFYFNDSIDEEIFFDSFICSVDMLVHRYDDFKIFDEKHKATPLYALIMSEIGKFLNY